LPTFFHRPLLFFASLGANMFQAVLFFYVSGVLPSLPSPNPLHICVRSPSSRVLHPIFSPACGVLPSSSFFVSQNHFVQPVNPLRWFGYILNGIFFKSFLFHVSWHPKKVTISCGSLPPVPVPVSCESFALPLF